MSGFTLRNTCVLPLMIATLHVLLDILELRGDGKWKCQQMSSLLDNEVDSVGLVGPIGSKTNSYQTFL